MVSKIRSGFSIGDQVVYNETDDDSNTIKKQGVVVNGSHSHNGLNEGTFRLAIRLEDGTVKKVAPWLIEKVESTDASL